MSTVTRPETRFIKQQERDDVLYVTLDRPPLNVLTISMMSELIGVFDQVAARQDSLRAVVLRGAGKAYSAGVDISEHQGETLRPLLDSFHRLMLRVLASPVPVISVVHGYAFGGGCELATVSDMVLIAEDAKIGVPEIKLAVFPPAAAVLFPRLIGTHRALELILTGEPISGAEAARIGLANRAVPAAELDAALEALLARLRATSAAALRLARRAVLDTLDRSTEEALHYLEQVQVEQLIPSHDAQEGLRAFLEKRAPVWQHR
ncbi:MAG: enoyl-CoA hydratase/isomerase family protein [Armatimonadota bacterium]|nr:enoyl-CoA hydratase/isomerase family protein [Armatimonadota bacterium]